jgi:hypothetical protein
MTWYGICGIMAIGLPYGLALWSMCVCVCGGGGGGGFGSNSFVTNDAAIPNGWSL